MKFPQKLIGSLIALGAFGMVLGPGCADNRSSIFAVAALAVPQDTCEWTSDDSNAFVPAGRLDLALSNVYWIPILIGNQLVRRGNAATLRTETSRVSFYEAEVNLTDSAGTPIANAYFAVPVSGFADAAAGTDPGFGSVAVTLIDGGSSAELKKSITQDNPALQIVANVVVRGETLGNVEVETDTFAFPITVCDSAIAPCLVYFNPEGDDPARPGLDCDIRDEAPLYCRMGMDANVDCRACAGINPTLCAPPP